jgi:hypothetical protein
MQKREKGGNFDNRELPEQDMQEEKYKIRTQRSFYDRKQFHQNQDGGGQYQQQQHYFKKKQFSVKKAEKYAKYRAKVAAKYGQVN